MYDCLGRQYGVVDLWAQRPRRATFVDVTAIVTDSDDRVYVVNRGVRPIMVFDRDGQFLRSWSGVDFSFAHGACIGPDGGVYCTDAGAHTVRKFSPDGELLLTIGSPTVPSETGYVGNDYRTITHGGPPFNRPTDVAVASSGDIYVADGYGNARVHRFSPEGKLLSSWGEPGDKPGQFHIPHGIVIDSEDRLFVADRENNRIQIFTLEGELTDIWPDLHRPNSMCLGIKGTYCVAELEHRVSFWDASGKRLACWGQIGAGLEAGGFVAPHAVAIDSRGDVYVGEVSESAAGIDRGSRTLQKFAMDGSSERTRE